MFSSLRLTALGQVAELTRGGLEGRADPRVAVVTTGGTIEHFVGDSNGVAELGYDVANLLDGVAAAGIDVSVDALFQKGSRNLTPDDWGEIAGAVRAALDEGVDGIVVLHGTDTMHYSAAAVAFAMGLTSVPIVFTGSIMPGSQVDGDATDNLRDAIAVAAFADIAEVCVVFSADEARTHRAILRGVCSKKMHSTAVGALRSPMMAPLGLVRDGAVTLTGTHRRRGLSSGVSSGRLQFDARVGLIKLHPGLTASVLETYLGEHSAVVVEGTGVGHLHDRLYEVVAAWKHPVVVSTQTPFGGESLGQYAGDQALMDLPNVIQGGAMTSETAYVKLSWCLAGNADPYVAMTEELVGEFGGDLSSRARRAD